MFAFSITLKLLTWYLALKYGDEGPAKRPWILGVVIGGIFAVFDLEANYQWWSFQQKTEVCAIYLVAAVAIMKIYWRVQNNALSLLIAAIGTAILFFGVPYFVEAILFHSE